MAKKIVIKREDSSKKVKILNERPKIEIVTEKKKEADKEKEMIYKKYRVTWNKVINTVNDDGSPSSELRVFVRIMAFGALGRPIMDSEGKNREILEWEKLPSAARKIIPKPWTFIEGSSENPLELKQGASWTENKKIDFKIPIKIKNAKICIWVDAMEYDLGNNADDFYQENTWVRRVSEIPKKISPEIVIREGAARLTFKFTISPIK